jgi:hypothetical protein
MNRRSFVTKLGLLTGWLALSFEAYPFKLKRTQKITGTVKNGKKALARVAVTDGYSTVLTDYDGAYSFTSHPDAKFVYISVPAGYEFMTNNNLATSFFKLDSRDSYDFNLKKLNKNDSKHQFIIWADPQVKNKKDVAQMMATSVPDVKQYLAKLPKGTLIHGISVGDLVWDDLSFFNDYNEAVSQMGIPFHQVLGNHDMNYNQGGDETSDQTFKEFYGPTYYSFNRGQAHYIILDDVRYLGSERLYDGYISQDQLKWMKNDLQYVPKDSLIIISAHIPIHNAVKNNSEFYALLSEFKNVHVMTGHTHNNTNTEKDGVYEHTHGAVCGAWWTGPICGDGAPRGYGIYEVNGTELKWHYKSTGLPSTHQISISLDELTNQKRLIANVWNWDSQWKVEYYLDDKYMGVLENQKGFDPLAVKLYEGKDKPSSRGFVEPKLNAHMFVSQFAPEITRVKVVATDRFGTIYEASANF